MLRMEPLAARTGSSPGRAVARPVDHRHGRRRGRGPRGRGAILAAGLLVAAAPACPGDVVTVASGADRTGRSQITGEVLDYTGRTLRVRRASGRVESIPSDRVMEVESSWGVHQTAGDEAFERKEYAKAAEEYRQALAHETRAWVQRRILARIVWCRRYLQQWEAAAEAFLAILRSDPATQDFAAIPLAWASKAPSAAFQQRAADWLDHPPSAAAALIGASWLLATRRRADAQQSLRRLVSDGDLRIGFLAEAQQWRTRTAVATLEEADRWRARIERMPPPLRAGPYFTLGRALTHLQLHEQAALAYLRAPILYPEDRAIAAEALLAAALELEKLRRPEEAASLYHELITNYPDSAAAAAAKTRLEQPAETSRDDQTGGGPVAGEQTGDGASSGAGRG